MKNISNFQDYLNDQLEGELRSGSSYLKFLNGMRNSAGDDIWTHGL